MTRKGTLTLSGGRVVQLRMPNMYELLAIGGGAANPQTAAILRLLEGAEALPRLNELQRQIGLTEYYRGLYELARACLVEPKLILEGEPGKGEIGPDDLAFGDLFAVFNSFFWADAGASLFGMALAPANPPAGAAPAPRDGDDVPHAAE